VDLSEPGDARLRSHAEEVVDGLADLGVKYALVGGSTAWAFCLAGHCLQGSKITKIQK
jgi:hypothetical protein